MAVSFKRSLYKNIAVIGGYNYSYTLIQFIASIFLSRLLLPEEYGIVALIMVFTGFISFFKDAGLSYLIIREDYNDTFYRSIHYVAIAVGLFLWILIIAIAYPVSLFYNNPLLLVPTLCISVVLIIESTAVIPTAIIYKRLDFNKLGKINFVSYTLGSIVSLIFAYYGFSYWSLIIGQFVSVLMIAILVNKVAPVLFLPRKIKLLVVGLRKSRSILLNISSSRFIQYWSNNSDNLIIGKTFGADPLGIYNRAYQLLTMQLNLISGIFNATLLPSLKEIKSDEEYFQREYMDALSLMSLVIFPISMVLIVWSEPLIRLIWGPDWVRVAEITPYFGVLAMTFLLSKTFGSVYILNKKENLLFRLGIFATIVSVIAVIIGAQYSIVAVAIFFSISFINLIMPVVLYVAFYKAFKFGTTKILKFWTIKIIGSDLIIGGLYYNIMPMVWIGLVLILLDLIRALRHQLSNFLKIIRQYVFQ